MSHAEDTRDILARSEPFHTAEHVALLEQRRISVSWALDSMPTVQLREAQILKGGPSFDPIGHLGDRYSFTGDTAYSLQMKGLFGPLSREFDADGNEKHVAWGLTRTDYDWVIITANRSGPNAKERASTVYVERVEAAQLVAACGAEPLLVWFALEEIISEWCKRTQERARRAEKLAVRFAIEREFYYAQTQAFYARQAGTLAERLTRIESFARTCGHPHASLADLSTSSPLLAAELEVLVAMRLSTPERELVHSRLISRILNVPDCKWHNVHELVSDALSRIGLARTSKSTTTHPTV